MAKIKVTNPKQIINGGAKKYYFKVKGVGGIKGDKGDKGDTGSQGPQGPQGNAATIEVGSTTTLPTGYDATVTNTGTINNAILNFGIPRGIKGDTGAKGDKGDKGDKGEQGNTGPQGPAGQNATVYVGTTTTGAPGTQASVYNSGTDRNAVLNFTIPQGAKGDTGATGATGPQGPAGQDGQNFTPTIVETLPATGDQSKLYLTPKNYATGTATGNPITISLSEDAGQIDSFQLDGDTYQQTYTGKNCIGFQDQEERTVNGLTYSVKDGIVTVNGTATSTTYTDSSTLFNFKEAGDITLSIEILGGTQSSSVIGFSNRNSQDVQLRWQQVGPSTGLKNTKAIDAQTIAGTANIRLFLNKDSVFNDFKFRLMAEYGSTATTYEPFVGGQPSPNPDYPQPIQTVTGEQTVEVTGKNLFDKNNVTENSVLEADGTLSFNTTDYSTSALIPVKPSTTYYKSRTDSVRFKFYDAKQEPTSSVYTDIPTAGNAQSFATPSDCYYVRFTFKKTLANTVQLELGSTATAYAPYSKQTLPIDLGSIELCKIGYYQDYIWKDGEDWKVHKATATITLDGSSDENWDKSNNVFFEYSGYSYLGDIGAGSTAFSTRFIYWPNTGGISNNMPNLKFGFPATKVGIGIRNDSISNTDALRTWLSTNVFEAYVCLATPTDTTITDTALIAQLEAIRTASLENGANTITNTATGSNLAGDMEIGYYGYNPTNRYDKWLWLDINNEYEKLVG